MYEYLSNINWLALPLLIPFILGFASFFGFLKGND